MAFKALNKVRFSCLHDKNIPFMYNVEVDLNARRMVDHSLELGVPDLLLQGMDLSWFNPPWKTSNGALAP